MKSLKKMVCVVAVVLLNAAVAAGVPPQDPVSARMNARANILSARANGQANLITARANASNNAISSWITAQAKLLSAKAEMITALANVRQTDAKTLQTLQQVRSLSLDNKVKTTKTFYEKRKLRSEYLAAENRKRLSKKDRDRYSKASLPKRPGDRQLHPDQDKIYWPHALQHERFIEYREQLDRLFAKRGMGSGIGDGTYQQVQDVAGAMQADLRSMIRQMPPAEYLQARRFIDSLVFESRFAKRIEGVAANGR